MSPQKDNMLQFNQYTKLDKIPYIIQKDIPSRYSMSTIWAFDNIENKQI